MLIFPPCPTAPLSTILKIFPSTNLVSPSISSRTFPALPCPEVLLCNKPPSSKENEPALIVILPALPIVSDSVSLKIALKNPSASLPDISTSLSTSISTFPALP